MKGAVFPFISYHGGGGAAGGIPAVDTKRPALFKGWSFCSNGRRFVWRLQDVSTVFGPVTQPSETALRQGASWGC